MKRYWLSVWMVTVFLGDHALMARESEGSRTNSVLLNGPWEFCVGTGDEGAERSVGQGRLQWKPVTLPGPFMPWNQEVANRTKVLWARRSFAVTSSQAEAMAVLRWNRIANGAEAFINGQMVGENDPTGPYQVIVPEGVLRSGENQILLKIRGAAGVRRSRSGNPLIPAGFGVGMPGVTTPIAEMHQI